MSIKYRLVSSVLILMSSLILSCGGPQQGGTNLRFEVTLPESIAEPMDGRVLLLLSTKDDSEPRFHAVSRRDPQPFFGIEVADWQPGEPAVIDGTALGFPVESIADLPAGEYFVQAVLNVYTTFHRSDGHTIKLHMDQWEGQRWNSSPGNLYSKPEKIAIDPAAGGTVRISLTEKMPPVDPPDDTRYVKHVKIKSDRVSEFWGCDMYIGAVVLLPEGFESHPNARYPVAYSQGHFSPTFRGFREEPPDPEATGRELAAQERGHAFYQEWISDRMPRMLVVVLQDPNPYYDDAYAVNSANVGPYGDAVTQELIPHVEKEFRAIGEPWSRTTYGGSTGGWRALAAQVFYPDFFNGTWVFCADPVDFRYFQLVNIYEDENASYSGSGFKKNPIRAWMRSVDDQVLMTQREASILELVLGTRGRSGDQMDIFQAIHGPVAEDGYVRLLYDKKTGVIDREVAEYWRENYDLRYILERDWSTLGPKLVGKLHIFMGDTDTYYLEEATILLQKFLESTENPYYGGVVEFGERAPHCWTGAPRGTNTTLYYLPAMAEHIRKTAPRGADLTSWKY